MNKISPEMPELQSMDITADNITKLKSLFPEAFSEGSIDFDVLKQLLGANVDEKKNVMDWTGMVNVRRVSLLSRLLVAPYAHVKMKALIGITPKTSWSKVITLKC